MQRDYRVKLWLALPAHLEAFLDRGAFRTAVFDPREVPLLETPALPPERFTWLKKRRGCLLPVLAALPSAAIVIVLLLT